MVAPMDCSRAAFESEAVVMIGENPASLATWIAANVNVRQGQRLLPKRVYLPYCPTEDAPPMIIMGFPEDAFAPAGSHKGVRPRLMVLALGSVEYTPNTTVASPRGTDAAWS